jgi:predicted DNA-binding transcriptional regulator AlpA
MSTIDPNITDSNQPLLIDAKRVAAMLGRCERSIWRDNEAGRIPRPIELGGTKRWRLKELRQWVRAGCPAREAWESRWKEQARQFDPSGRAAGRY